MRKHSSGGILAHPSIETPLLDLIMEILQLLVGEEAFYLLKAMEIHCIACVIDTNILLQDIGRAVRKQERTALVRAAQTGIVRLYASTTVRDEVPEKILMKHRELHFDQNAGIATWEQVYAPLITFLDPKDIRKLSKETTTLQLRDPDDVPTGQIVELIQPDAIFSVDADLEDFVTVPEALWTQLMCALRDHAERDIAKVAIIFGGGIVVQVSLDLLYALLQLLLMMNRKVLLALGIGLAVALTIPQSRRFLIERGQLLLDMLLNEQIYEFAKKAGAFLLENHETKKEARKFIAQHERLAQPRKALEYMTLVLSRTPAVISARRIVEQMIDLGYTPRGAHPERYVRHLLKAHPNLFEEVTPGQWKLMSHPKKRETGFGA